MATLCLLGTSNLFAQNDRGFIREGNRAYRAKKWAAAETQYRKAISKNGKNAQAVYNLGCALMMQQKDSAAMLQYEQAAKLEPNLLRRAMCYHNMGVVLQNHREYAQAIESYKNALRCNPQDNETRYNLALCKKLLKNQQQNKNNQNNKDNKNNKDKNKDNKDKNKDQDKKNQDQNKQNQDKNQNKDKNKDNQNNQQNKQNQDKMSRDNAEQLLQAAVQQEKATKQKLQKAMSQPRRKAYDKNW